MCNVPKQQHKWPNDPTPMNKIFGKNLRNQATLDRAESFDCYYKSFDSSKETQK